MSRKTEQKFDNLVLYKQNKNDLEPSLFLDTVLAPLLPAVCIFLAAGIRPTSSTN